VITGPLRTGRSLSRTPGPCTLYIEAPGDNWHADECIGLIHATELAEAIVAAVNAQTGLVPRAQQEGVTDG
jgi:hypothetical protein